MKSRCLLTTGALLAFLPTIIFSQGFTIPLRVANNGTDFDTVRFGVHVQATNCIDNALGEQRMLGCSLPEVFCVLLRTYPGCEGYSVEPDLRKYSNPTQIDTYFVEFIAGTGGYPLTFSWPDLNSYYSDSVKLQDEVGGFLVNVNMKTHTSYNLTTSVFNKLRIIAKGPVVITDVEENSRSSTSYLLHQNYPNPFNPTTTLSFVLPHSSLITLKVYDILGQEVKLLLDNERLEQGNHKIEFDAGELPSGVYFYRIFAGEFVETKKMLFVK